MCLAIANVKGSISKQSLLNGWKANPDGAGLLYISSGKLMTFKELRSFENFYAFYMNLRVRNRKSVLIHFRWATHGRKDELNCHPHLVNKSLGFIHNGVIGGVGFSPDKSDTVLFNEVVLQKLPGDFLSDHKITSAIAENIGNSKLAFLNAKNEIKIINEHMGHWFEGNWYSNTSYRARMNDWSHIPTMKTKTPAYTPPKTKAKTSYNQPSLFEESFHNKECVNCGSKHAEYDEDIDCYICYTCRKNFLFT